MPVSDDEVSAETISVAGMIREIRNLRVEVARLRAKLDDTIGVLAKRNRKLDWTRGQFEAAEEVVEAARRVRWAEKHEEGIADAYVGLDRALARYDARRER